MAVQVAPDKEVPLKVPPLLDQVGVNPPTPPDVVAVIVDTPPGGTLVGLAEREQEGGSPTVKVTLVECVESPVTVMV